MSAAERKAQADLIRHRELNALRKLMWDVDKTVPILLTDKYDSVKGFLSPPNSSALENAAPLTLLDKNTDASGQPLFLHKVALLFAQGDMGGTLQALEFALSAHGDMQDHMPTWLILLDFYRATHNRVAFEAASLAYANRFGRSAPPAWVAIGLLQIQKLRDRAVVETIDWVAPSYLDDGALQKLRHLLDRRFAMRARLVIMDWRGLTSIDPSQYKALQAIFAQIAAQNAELRWYGLASLETALQPNEQTVSLSAQDKNLDGVLAQQLLARLALFRLLNRQILFEDTALQYCVLFEVSPPDWAPPDCELSTLDSPLQLIAGNQGGTNDSNSAGFQGAQQTDAQSQTLQLQGEVLGELSAQQLMQFNQATLQTGSAQVLSVACHDLMRCDQEAAESLLAWVRLKKAEGRIVEFKNVHRLIAALFLTLDFYSHARVVIRKD